MATRLGADLEALYETAERLASGEGHRVLPLICEAFPKRLSVEESGYALAIADSAIGPSYQELACKHLGAMKHWRCNEAAVASRVPPDPRERPEQFEVLTSIAHTAAGLARYPSGLGSSLLVATSGIECV